MTDFLGNEVHIGDEVVYLNHYRTSSHLEMGTVSGIAPKTAYIGGKRREGSKIINLSSLRTQNERENPKPITNADRIRAMSDEEIAKIFTSAVADGCPPKIDWDCAKDEYGWDACDACWCKWLQQPAEGE